MERRRSRDHPRARRSPPAHHADGVDAEQEREGAREHHDRNRGGAAHVILLEAGKMSSGTISVFSGMLPEMNTTDPYSPSARANERANPVSSVGSMAGAITRASTRRRPAPSTAAASSMAGSRSRRTGWSVRTTKGR